MQRVLNLVNRRFPFIKYSSVASQVFRFLDSSVPLKMGFLKHKKGFSWKIDGWYSLWTYLTGCEPYTTKIVEDIVSRDVTTFICVGANRGWYPLIVQQISQEASQYIFEPNPKTFSILQGNLLRNCTRAKIYNVAISDFIGQSDLFTYQGINDGATTLFPSTEINSHSKIVSSVQIKTLDFFFEKGLMPVGRHCLLLLDIEGAEYHALRGATNFIRQSRPTLIFEVNLLMLNTAGSLIEEFFIFLSSLGYQMYWIHEKGFLVKQESHSLPVHLNELRMEDSTNYIAVSNGYDVSMWPAK